MDNERDSMFWTFFIDFAVVVAAAMLYFKTSEVMIALAPVTLLGQTGLAILYGTVVALLIEGVTLALHFLKSYTVYARAEPYKWFLFGISTFCQFLDTSLVKDTAHQTETEAFFAWAALGILPAVFFGLLWVRAGKKSSSQPKERRQRKGIIPSFKEFLYGEESTVLTQETSVVLNKDFPAPEKIKQNGKPKEKTEETNPQ